MKEIDLMDNEKIITYADNMAITLTTHRIVFRIDTSSLTRNTSIMLEQLTSTDFLHKRKSFLTFLALLFGIAGIFLLNYMNGEFSIILFVVSAICVFYYYTSQKSYIVFTTAGNSIEIPSGEVSKSEIEKFIKKVEQEKVKRISNISPNSSNKSTEIKPFDLLESLEKLGDLREKGVLTELEFQEHKKKLLN